MKNKLSIKYIIGLSIVGVIINLLFSLLVKFVEIPFYLDTIGTIVAGAVGGYLPGVLVGFTTNLILAIDDGNKLYYSFINMLCAIVSAYFAGRGYYKNLWKTLLTIPVYVVMTTITASLCSWFLNGASMSAASVEQSQLFGNTGNLAGFLAQFFSSFFIEFIDKGISVLLAYLALHFMPSSVKHKFIINRDWVKELNSNKGFLKKKKSPFSSIRSKMVLMISFCAIFVAVIISFLSYVFFRDSSVDEHIKSAKATTGFIGEIVDSDKIDDYLTAGNDSEEYKTVEEKLGSIYSSNEDMYGLYILKVENDGLRVVYNIDSDKNQDTGNYEKGTLIDFKDIYADSEIDFKTGNEIKPQKARNDNGSFLRIFEPVKDKDENVAYYVEIEFSMGILKSYSTIFMARVMSIFFGFFIFILTLVLTFVEHNIILPLNVMSKCTTNFAYDTEENRQENIKKIMDLKINTKDEIEKLYHALVFTVSESFEYVEGFQDAREQVVDMEKQVEEMDEIAYKDGLTGIKNKAAYQIETEEITNEIKEGKAVFSIYMIDLNFLKRVNDNYGHEKGDIYLKNCAELICEIFGYESVYRFGGDEFVAIKKEDHTKAVKFMNKFNDEIAKLANDDSKEPWEKVSAAIGIATFNKKKDKTVDEVFKRADEEMYKNKIAMKAQRTD